MPSLSLTACTIRCREPRYLSVVSTDRCPSRNRICSSSPPAEWQSLAQVRRRSWGATFSMTALSAAWRTDPPDHLLADTRTPHGAAVGDTTEDQPVLNASNRQPFIHRGLYPAGNRHRAQMTSFSEQV